MGACLFYWTAMLHTLIQLSSRLWYMDFDPETDRPNLGYIRGDRIAAMFDCGASPAHVAEFFAKLQQNDLPLPSFAILSHWHWDHALGMRSLDIPVIAGVQTNEKLKEVSAWEWTEEAMAERLSSGEDILFCDDHIRKEYGGQPETAPRFRTADATFKDSLELDLGGLSIRLLHVGGPHAEDSIVCYVPEERFIFLGDSAGKDLYATPWNYDPDDPEVSDRAMEAIPYDLPRLQHYLDILQQLSFDRCLEGHTLQETRAELFDSLK